MRGEVWWKAEGPLSGSGSAETKTPPADTAGDVMIQGRAQAKLATTLRRRMVAPIAPKPVIIMAQVEGSGAELAEL